MRLSSMATKKRYCSPCDALTNANPCTDCGADTERWPADGSETDREYQRAARSPAETMRTHLDTFGR